MTRAQVIIGVWLLLLAVQTHRQVRTFRSDMQLWGQAVQMAPEKPRPRLNYGLALLRAGRFDEAERAFLETLALVDQPHVPAWDRREARDAATRNLMVVPVMKAMGAAEIR